MGRDLDELAAGREHVAPFWGRGPNAEAEEAQRGPEQNRLAGQEARLDDERREVACGRTWRARMRASCSPAATAAWTNSSCRTSSTRPRTRRARGATKLLVVAAISPFIPAPATLAMAMARIRLGIVSKRSESVMSIASVRPPA